MAFVDGWLIDGTNYQYKIVKVIALRCGVDNAISDHTDHVMARREARS
ncbi:MAG: hypothetical protein ACOYMQ_12510 [Pseudanabaena sp.]